MDKIPTSQLQSYEESIIVDKKIEKILTLNTSYYKKKKLLKQLQEESLTLLSQSHISYYYKKLLQKRFAKYEQMIALLPFFTFPMIFNGRIDLFLLFNIFYFIASFVLALLKRKVI